MELTELIISGKSQQLGLAAVIFQISGQKQFPYAAYRLQALADRGEEGDNGRDLVDHAREVALIEENVAHRDLPTERKSGAIEQAEDLKDLENSPGHRAKSGLNQIQAIAFLGDLEEALGHAPLLLDLQGVGPGDGQHLDHFHNFRRTLLHLLTKEKILLLHRPAKADDGQGRHRDGQYEKEKDAPAPSESHREGDHNIDKDVQRADKDL